MMDSEQIRRLRAATDRLAEKVRQLSQGNPEFDPIIAELEAMGTDNANPIPSPDDQEPSQ